MRVLLVSPRFHGYHSAIAAALTARGHIVSTHLYDDNGGPAGRILHQVRHQLPRKVGAGSHRGLTREQTTKAVRAVHRLRPEAVVVVKADTLDQDFWDCIKGLPRVTWLYDELRRTRYTPDRLAAIGPVATYSLLDAEHLLSAGLDARYLPLAFDHRLVPSPSSIRMPVVSFVGARYPAREHVLKVLHDHEIPVRAYGRDWSAHPVDRLRTWRVSTPTLPAERDIGRAQAYDVMASSSATLNLHGDQDGFTMRTFEAAGVGGVELVDRTDVAGLYELGTEVLAFSDLDELVDLCQKVMLSPDWTRSIREAGRSRTLAEHTFDHRVAVLEAAWDTPHQVTS